MLGSLLSSAMTRSTGGATVLKPSQDVFWGGYHAYVADPDGYPWEVAWNPGFPLDALGRLELPE